MLHYLAVLLQVPRLDAEEGLGVLSGEYHKKYLNLQKYKIENSCANIVRNKSNCTATLSP